MITRTSDIVSEAFSARLRSLSDQQIRDAVLMIGHTKTVADHARFVRAHLIDEFARRHGDDAADGLMDEAGL